VPHISDMFPPNMKRVQAGDWDELIQHIKDGGSLTDEMRSFLIGVLRGKIKRPPNRAASAAKLREYREISNYVGILRDKGISAEDANARASSHFKKKNVRTIQRAVKTWREYTKQFKTFEELDQNSDI
jgi:hypothetical protein